MLDLGVSIDGLRQLELALREIAPDLKKQMDREIRRSLQPYKTKAQSLAPPRPLRNWTETQGTGRWSGVRAYDQNTVKRGIAIRKVTPRRNAGAARSFSRVGTIGSTDRKVTILTGWQLQNRSASGMIYEVAGKVNRSGKSTAGFYFIKGLDRWARPSRLIWRAWDQLDGERTVMIESAQTAIKSAERSLASLIGAKVT